MLPVFPLPHSDLLVILAQKWAEYVRRIDGAEGGSRTHTTLRSTDFKSQIACYRTYASVLIRASLLAFPLAL
jgi:hypothetical protein